MVCVQLEDLGNTGGLEELTVQLAANAAISKRIDKLDGAFMLAIDTMLMQAERNNDPQVGKGSGAVSGAEFGNLSVVVELEDSSTSCSY